MAVGTNLRNVLGGRQLSRSIQLVKPGLSVEHLPPGLTTPTEGIEGHMHTMRQYTGARTTPTRVEYGAPSVRYTPTGVTEQNVSLISFANSVNIKAATLMNLESDSGDKQRLGEQEVDRIVKETATIQDNGRAAAVMSAFALGKIHYDSKGNLLPSSSNAQATIDYLIPANNRNQLNGIVSGSWANPATKITKQAQNIRKAAAKLNNYKPTIALYGSDIFNLLASNDDVQAYMGMYPAYQAAFMAGDIPDGFMGFKWYPAYMSYFVDQNGTAQEIFPADGITFMPEVSTEWYGFVEGTTPIPGDFGVAKSNLSDVLSGVATVRGKYSYAYGTVDPVGAVQVYGDCYLPEIHVPQAVFIADVVF